MAYSYGRRSQAVRSTLHLHLRNIFDRVLTSDDHALEHGVRAPEVQQEKKDTGRSQVPGFNSDGTVYPYPHRPRDDGLSWAVDTWPWINGKRLEVPALDEIERRVKEGDCEKWLANAIARYSQFAYFARCVLDVAEIYLKENRTTTEWWALRWGGNWNMDAEILTDQSFDDFPHWELKIFPSFD